MSNNPADDPNFIGKIIDQRSTKRSILYLSDKGFIFIKDGIIEKYSIDDVREQIPIFEEWSLKYNKVFPLVIDGTDVHVTPKEVIDFCLNDERLDRCHSAVIFINNNGSLLECAAMNMFIYLKDYLGGKMSAPAKMAVTPEDATTFLFHYIEGGQKIDSLTPLEIKILRLEFYKVRHIIIKLAKYYEVDQSTVRNWIRIIYEKLETKYLYRVSTMLRMSKHRHFFEEFVEPKTKDYNIAELLD